MKRGIQGRFESGTSREAFIPFSLPPEPPLRPEGELQDLIEEASRALGRLDGASTLLPDATLFDRLHVRKEAVLSCHLEGMHASLPELFLFESGAAPGVPCGDVREVSRLVAAIERGLGRIASGSPLSLPLLDELYGVVAGGGRPPGPATDTPAETPTDTHTDMARGTATSTAEPAGRAGDQDHRGKAAARSARGAVGAATAEREGEEGIVTAGGLDAAFRLRRHDAMIPGWHSEAQPYVPPPPEALPALMRGLEAFVRDEPLRTPALIKAGLALLQFQTIHPFPGGLDGTGGPDWNGPMSRLLVTLVLRAEGALSRPLLYLSLHFRRRRDIGRELVDRVREEGDWEAWLAFFLEGVARTAEDAEDASRRILMLIERDRTSIGAMGRAAESAERVHSELLRTPLLSIPQAGRLLPLTPPTLSSAFQRLEEAGIVAEITGRARDRLYAHRDYLEILNEGTSAGGS